MTPLEARIAAWQEKIPAFAKATKGEQIRGLNEELGELAMALIDNEGHEAVCKEAADIYIALVGMMALRDESLEAWVLTKMKRNEAKVDFVNEKQAARQRGAE